MATSDKKTREIAGARLSENEALIESSFRRLLASIESEREKMRATWRTIDYESDRMREELNSLRLETEEWCSREKQKIADQWRDLDERSERMTVRFPEASEILPLNCSGKFFQLQKNLLRNVEGSLLNHMFSDEFIQFVPRDQEGNFFLDFNPVCFDIIVKHLQRQRPDLPMPDVPAEQQMNMDLLIEALQLQSFVKPNQIQNKNATSLRVYGNLVEATHEGWQVVSAQMPLPMAGVSWFECKILSNVSKKGGIGIGVCGHLLQGNEVHSICVKDSIMYSSANGLIGGQPRTFSVSNVQDKVNFSEGSTIGVRYDVHTQTLTWYLNRLSFGTCTIATSALERMRTLYPVFALYVPGQKIEVSFLGPGQSPGQKPDDKATASTSVHDDSGSLALAASR